MSYEAWGEGDDNYGYVTDERAEEMVEEATAELRAALEESVKLQSHYAGLLNQYDGGARLTFTIETWLARLEKLRAAETVGANHGE